MSKLLPQGPSWTFDDLKEYQKVIEEIAIEDFGIDFYPNQLEIVTSEQMIDVYASTGLPVTYNHWRYGKYHSYQSNSYKKGKSGLAYEMVINSDPCISYLMENNNLVTQALVIAHACVDADTEYLSPTGWKKISNYTGGPVGQFTDNYEMEFVEPINYIVNENCEYMNEFENSVVHQRLTDDHRVVYVSHENNNLKVRPFHEIKKMHETKTRGFHGKFVNVFKPKINTSVPYSDNELRFLVAAFADGSIIGNKVRFHLKKERKINRLLEILNSSNINYFISDSYEGRKLITCDYKLENKYYTNDFYRSSIEQLKVITNEVLFWDGTISPQRRFFSTCKSSVDFIQYAFTSMGFRSSITETVDLRTDSERKKLYILNVTNQWKSGISGGRSDPPKIKQYKTIDNKSYCFTVPSGMLVFRSNNYIFVTGNCYGHNPFFKNNFLFKEWTHADSIVEYCLFARDYINKCELKYGYEEVEKVLDAAHSLENHGVDKYKRPQPLSPKEEKEMQDKRIEDDQKFIYEFWNTIPDSEKDKEQEEEKEANFPSEPQENLLYFIEKHSPVLKPWQREILRIVRKLAQYFYPQNQTRVSNEGYACTVEGTKVFTEDGLCDVKDIVNHKYSKRVWDGDKLQPVVDWFTNHNKKRIKLTTKKGYGIHGGFDHKIFINDDWKELKDFKVGESIKLSRGKNVWSKEYKNIDYSEKSFLNIKDIEETTGLNYIKFRRIKTGETQQLKQCDVEKFNRFDKLLNDNKYKKMLESKGKDIKFPKVLNEDFATWLGLMIGDGNLSRKARVICLTTGDEQIRDLFSDISFKLFGEYPKIVKQENRYRLKQHSTKLMNYLVTALGMKTSYSADRKEVPELILYSPKSVVSAFIRGLFDADGCVSNSQVIYITKSEKLSDIVQQLLLNFGIISSRTKQKSDDCYRILISGGDIKLYRDEIGFNLDRKQNKLNDFISNKKWFLPKDDISEIVKIELDEGITYDFSVENTNKYQSSAFINHNCMVHYEIIYNMFDNGYLTDGFMQNFLELHTNVVWQPDKSYLNPYYLGFNIYQDIKRICLDPTEEDKEWFPYLIGKDWKEEVKYAAYNFKDESFILQYLSPYLIRKMKLFNVLDDSQLPEYHITHISNDDGYKQIRRLLAQEYNRAYKIPDVQITKANIKGDRKLTLTYYPVNNIPLDNDDLEAVEEHLDFLWGFDTKIIEAKK